MLHLGGFSPRIAAVEADFSVWNSVCTKVNKGTNVLLKADEGIWKRLFSLLTASFGSPKLPFQPVGKWGCSP